MPNINLKTITHVYCIGIGGIGLSAIARMMLGEGKKVSGSDGSDSLIISELKTLGVEVHIGHSATNISKDVDLVVYTVAIPDNNPELIEAKSRQIITLTYPEMLGVVSEGKFTIALAGTHGKTTTTAMTAQVFVEAGLSPTVIVGSLLKESHSNFIAGTSEYFIVEACEYKRSFLNLSPSILVITNIDDDHLDYYGDLAGVQKAFREMAERLPKDGLLVTDLANENIKPILEGLTCRVVDYRQEDVANLQLQVPGEHNRANAQAVLAVAREARIDRGVVLKALAKFSGTWRRFEYKGQTSWGAKVYDDYGHHPTEVRATLAGARELFPRENITVVFQPHLYSRTREHLQDFSTAFQDANEVLLAPIYAAREPFDPSISSKILAEVIQKTGIKTQAFDDMQSIENYLIQRASPGVIVIMGAGDIYTMAEALVHAQG